MLFNPKEISGQVRIPIHVTPLSFKSTFSWCSFCSPQKGYISLLVKAQGKYGVLGNQNGWAHIKGASDVDTPDLKPELSRTWGQTGHATSGRAQVFHWPPVRQHIIIEGKLFVVVAHQCIVPLLKKSYKDTILKIYVRPVWTTLSGTLHLFLNWPFRQIGLDARSHKILSVWPRSRFTEDKLQKDQDGIPRRDQGHALRKLSHALRERGQASKVRKTPTERLQAQQMNCKGSSVILFKDG